MSNRADIHMESAEANAKQPTTYLRERRKVVEKNIEEAAEYIQTGHIDNPRVYSQTCMILGSSIDLAVAMNEVPSSTHLGHLVSIVKEVYERKTEVLQPSLMLLMLPIKAACKIGWFPDKSRYDLLMMAREVSNVFSDSDKMNIEPSHRHSYVSNIISRFYPKMTVERILASFDVKAGYGTFVADFHISKGTLPLHYQDLWLLVARMDNTETSACITSPPDVDFLVNGYGVPGRIRSDMITGPQLPSNLTKMVKYGINLLQVLGDFDGPYIIVVAFMNTIPSPETQKLQDYVHPVSNRSGVNSDCNVMEISSSVSLDCPISQCRIRTPVKGNLCKHPQCFDYKDYLEVNSVLPTWKCPICKKPVCNQDLRIDQNFAKILNEVATGASEAIISPDGSWTIMMHTVESNSRNTITKNDHLLVITENLTSKEEETNNTRPKSSFTLPNSTFSPTNTSAGGRSSDLRKSTLTTNAPQIQQLGDPQLQSQGPRHHTTPVNSTTTSTNLNQQKVQTHSTIQANIGPCATNQAQQNTKQAQSTTTCLNDVGTSTTKRAQSTTPANSPHSVPGHSQPARTVTPTRLTQPITPTQLTRADLVPSGRMRGSLKGDKLEEAQREFLAPPRQPARANQPWSRPTPTLPVALLMQQHNTKSDNDSNSGNLGSVVNINTKF